MPAKITLENNSPSGMTLHVGDQSVWAAGRSLGVLSDDRPVFDGRVERENTDEAAAATLLIENVGSSSLQLLVNRHASEVLPTATKRFPIVMAPKDELVEFNVQEV